MANKDIQELEKLRRELRELTDRRKILAKEVERARVRTTGRLTPASNRNFAASLEKDLKDLDKRIAAKRAEIKRAEEGESKS